VVAVSGVNGTLALMTEEPTIYWLEDFSAQSINDGSKHIVMLKMSC
jgi:hypothetical protein